MDGVVKESDERMDEGHGYGNCKHYIRKRFV